MFEHRLEITATLELLSPLHVGSGEDVTRSLREGADPVRINQVIRDDRGFPCLPGSTVKGILSRQVEGAAAVCGTARENDGEMGWLLVRMAPCQSVPSEEAMANLPYGEGETGKFGIFVEARTRIDRELGTAQDALLYHAEKVAPGTRFQLRLCLLKPERADLVRSMLAALTVEAGVAFGRGQTNGQGRIRLTDAPVVRTVLKGEERGSETWTLTPPVSEATTRLVLFCEGPYVALDSSKSAQRRKPTEDEVPEDKNEEPQLRALVDGDGAPALRGSALLGVMRARAAWIMAREQQTKMEAVDDPDRDFTTAADLTAIERLFGVSGFRGLVQVRSIALGEGHKPVLLTSVALDQFSMAPLDNALFTTKAFVRCRFDVALDLDGRAGPDDHALWHKLVEDARGNGLTLGHGGNKGFGWFTVEKANA